ncbi:MAG: hypothetical protein U0704_13260 [Candidatus Eisenbacteria bacterium]
MRKLLAILALLAVTLGPAHAGGLHATLEGPAADGVTYTVRALDCPPGVTLKPWVVADGLADGKLQYVRLDLQPTAEPGVYTFQRGWPQRGDWMLRVNLADPPPGPVTVAAVDRDGRVQKNQLFWNTYGVPECRRVLEQIARKKGIKLDEGC